jgi:hypothetical protein
MITQISVSYFDLRMETRSAIIAQHFALCRKKRVLLRKSRNVGKNTPVTMILTQHEYE